ncbi:MAG: polysaccharide biosynthesis tyrosine autokinase [Bacteroidales bacterium]|nr:polysaccharide biosynthesis tyrosine autokinase [Bacteroidales bacterium]MBD5337897.1 polysaccharide biosynthesis tyrosine autokinase [Bacteroides sp.]
METKSQKSVKDDFNSFSLKDFVMSCLAQWKWFVVSFIIFVALGMLYVIRQQPVFTRTMSVLIQDESNTGGLDVASAFKGFGIGGASTNVYNELISLQSPAVMFEVVKRLNLNISLTQLDFPADHTLYGKTSPMDVVYPEIADNPACVFEMILRPDDTYKLEKFKQMLPDGTINKLDYEVEGKLGFNEINTPVGHLTFRPNGTYTNNRKDEIRIQISIRSIAGTVETYVQKLKGDLADADAEVIDLTIDDVSVQRATDILNTVVEVYNEFWVRDKNRMAVATSEFIDERLKSLVQELSDVDTKIAEYQSEHMMPDLEQTARMRIDETASVNKGLLEATNQLAMAKYIRDYIANPSNNSNVVPVNTGMGSAALEKLIADYNTLLLTRNNLLANSSEENPIVADYDNQIKGMRESLLKSVNAQVGVLQANLKNLEGADNQNKAQLASTPNQAKYLGSIKRDQEIKNALYLYLLQKREENNISQAFNAYNTRIITPPYGPLAPIAPRKGVTLMICAVLGLMLPAVIIYFVVVCDTKVRGRRDMENLPIPFTGEIPQIGNKHRIRNFFKSRKKRQKEIDTPRPIVEEGKRDVPNEAFRVVRSNIDLMLGKRSDHPVIMVTSFNPGSGKSFIAYNLGASFALKHKRVLLIDGDLRHGSLSTYVGSPRRGLAAFLTGNVLEASKIAYPVEGFEGFDIIPIGKRPPNPAELLEGDRFGDLLDQVRANYDVIMVDCPPVNVVVDTQLLNRYADATLFVVRAGLLERKAIPDLTTLYNEKKLKRMSILLNGTEAAHSSYYTYGNYQSLEE